SYRTQHVIRWSDCDGTGVHPAIIATFPAGNDCCHKGGRIAFGPDGKLYVTLGDQHDAPSAQNVNDVRGKVLRYNPDGSIPSNNPFGARDPVWAYGFRNPFGIAFSATGQLAITMNGPSGDAGSPGTGYDTLYLNVTRAELEQRGEHLRPDRCDLRRRGRAGRLRGPPRVLHVRQGHGHRDRGQS